MLVSISNVKKIRKQDRATFGWLPAGDPIEYADIEAIENADSEQAQEALLMRYSSPSYPFFGHSDWAAKVNDDACCEDDLVDLTDTADIRNFRTLVEVAMRLFGLTQGNELTEEIEDELGIAFVDPLADLGVHNPDTQKQMFLELNIKLENSIETYEFLEAGTGNGIWCKIESEDDGILHLILRSTPIDADKFLDLKAFEEILNKLSAIMLHDLAIGVEDCELTIVSETVASTLWHTLIQRMREGEYRVCPVCMAPFIDARSRGKTRRYCRKDSCRKTGSRLKRFKKCIGDGADEIDAAKQAKLDLVTAKRLLEQEEIVYAAVNNQEGVDSNA